MIAEVVLAVVLLPVATLWLLPVLTSLGSGVFQAPKLPSAASEEAPRLLFLIPAHDEALLIGRCVASLLAMRDRAGVRAIVLADNCHDATATTARQAGAEVLERTDPTRPGKPAAIAWALEQLQATEYDALVIIDADTTVDSGFAEAIAGCAPLGDIALQARFGVADAGATWLTRLASLWVEVRYDRQFARKQAAGLNVVLTGNGMYFGRHWLKRVRWVSEGLTEDLALYARATRLGERIIYAPGARLYAQEAKAVAQGVTQRRRWQAGRWQVLRAEGSGLLRSRVVGPMQKLDALAELLLPGPVLHSSVALLLAACLFLLGGNTANLVAGLFLLSVLPLVATTLTALLRRPDRLRLALDCLMLPGYAVWRMLVAVSTAFRPSDGQWRRSPRHAPPPAP